MNNSNKITCPACQSELTITKLVCQNCNTEVTGRFEQNWFVKTPFQNLSEDDWKFVSDFLLCEGNFSRLQSLGGETYATIKSRLNYLLQVLGLKAQDNQITEEVLSASQPTINDGMVVKAIKEKLADCGGKAHIPMLKGNDIEIWLAEDGSGVVAAGLKNVVLRWEHFEAVVKEANRLNGIMYRGDSAAQSGKKIGSDELPLETIDSFVSRMFYGAKIGDTTLRRSTYYAGILAWAEIVKNHRSNGNGKGGYISVNTLYKI